MSKPSRLAENFALQCKPEVRLLVVMVKIPF
jgi:hypothetical protein